MGTTAGSGGTIQNISNNGIELRQTDFVSISNLNLTNANTTDNCGTEAYDETGGENCRGAIYMNDVQHVLFDNIAINGTAEQGITGVDVTHLQVLNSSIVNAGNSIAESGILLRDLLGIQAEGNTNVISGTTVNNSAQIGIFVRNLKRTSGVLAEADRLEITNSTVTNSGDNTAADNVTISVRDDASNVGANFQTVVSGSTFTGVNGEIADGIQIDAGINAVSQLSISNTTFNNNNTAINITGANNSTTYFDVSNNPNINTDGGQGINFAVNGTASMIGTIANNVIDSFNANNPGFGIDAVVDATGSLVARIDNNIVTDFSIPLRAGARNAGGGTADVTITNNTLNSGGGFAFGAVWVFSGNGSGGESNAVCVNLANNNANDPFGTQEYYVEQYPGNTFTLQGYAGAANSQAAIQTFIEGNNLTGDALVETCCGTTINVTGGTCLVP